MSNNNHQVLQCLRDAEFYAARGGSADQALDSLIEAVKLMYQRLGAGEREIQALKRRLD
jgi:hypothetical protein